MELPKLEVKIMAFKKELSATLAICASIGLIVHPLDAQAKVPTKTHRSITQPLSAAQTYQAGQPLGVDISDIARYSPRSVIDSKLLTSFMQSNDPHLVSDNAKILGLEHLQNAPTTDANGNADYTFVIMMENPHQMVNDPRDKARFDAATSKRASAIAKLQAAGRPVPASLTSAVAPIKQDTYKFFRKVKISVGGSPRAISDVQVVQDIPLTSTHFTSDTGLISRMVVLEDTQNDILIVYPLSVGAIDMNMLGGGNRILTPLFQQAVLKRSTVIDHLNSPAYYRNMPYMPITNKRGTTTGVAFHITIQYDDAGWKKFGPTFLMRGYDSHGCMRLRGNDLTEYHTIVTEGGDDAIPVTVDYFVYNRNNAGVRDASWDVLNVAHPYPLTVDHYNTVGNCPDANGSYDGTPHGCRGDDVDHLVILVPASGQPDLSDLTDFSADDMTDNTAFIGLEKLRVKPVPILNVPASKLPIALRPKPVDPAPSDIDPSVLAPQN